MNISKLKGKMVEKKYTQKKLAEELGMTVQALNAKLNNRSQFKIEEAVKISNILQIEEPSEIFFDNYIPKMQRN
ncbi:helix-turn-helix transcriptional regulator [Clostridioides difficile]|uniref:helix-turn-helix transcriptional regulator n=1 Tax=Clostridioides difficile TaxID=1496 RepID=UPI00093946A4|nr:helix-turn-helix transcriptional regulator [Clostridioides difficile]EGT3800871.1 XRE family transcriptional regulator [Clostridioides difficile]EGT4002919.1 XRE family transcriptional regulator [Clostridioides difficile]EGT5271424.1 XRE family transcriptional regulator [Clostridioides difficile]EGT5470840.1 XRE family transcriptional regulator [Clostridioides difficile]MBH6911053.1 helix-turn-helix transcriptional regulator [Clostridioides difficile]